MQPMTVSMRALSTTMLVLFGLTACLAPGLVSGRGGLVQLMDGDSDLVVLGGDTSMNWGSGLTFLEADDEEDVAGRSLLGKENKKNKNKKKRNKKKKNKKKKGKKGKKKIKSRTVKRKVKECLIRKNGTKVCRKVKIIVIKYTDGTKKRIKKVKKVKKFYPKTAGDQAKVKCVTKTTKKAVTKSKNANVDASAIAAVFAKVCKPGYKVLAGDFDFMFKSGEALVFAKTIAKASIKCRTSDPNSMSCFSVSASAEAYAQATAKAHADAVSMAVNSCGCLNEAATSTFSSASTYIKLIAQAASTAVASVCFDGTDKVKADKRFDKCIAKMYGTVYAKAVSLAIVKGKCDNAKAVSDVLAETGADLNGEACDVGSVDAIKIEEDAS